MNKNVYTQDELYNYQYNKGFTSDAEEAAFLLGGIGTGNISIGARGELRDWEIFNRPSKGLRLPYTFFAIRAQLEGGDVIAKVLEAQLHEPFSKSHGFSSGELAGLPRLDSAMLKGRYPFVELFFEDNELPVQVSLEAFTPFIPLNPDDSGIPCTVLKYRVKNTASSPVDVTLMGSMVNVVGFNGYNMWGNLDEDYMEGNINDFRQEGGLSGLFMHSSSFKEEYIRYGSMCMITPDAGVTAKPVWEAGAWWDGIQDLWDDFCEDGLLRTENDNRYVVNGNKSRIKPGSLGIAASLMPQEERDFTFVLSWYFPNRKKSWYEEIPRDGDVPVVRNYYSRLFRDAWDAGRYVLTNYERLESDSRRFQQALFGSTLPEYVIDAVAANITVLRSTTCFRLEDGSFLGWEGCHDQNGCCEGTCTHVWNYAQTLAFLFPTLEQSMRRIEFSLETNEAGKMAFRSQRLFQEESWDYHAAADGQMGTIIRLYREWKVSGDSQFLKEVWKGAARALDFAFTHWDSDGDSVLDNQQHNTYDIEFYGPNSLVNSMFYGALKAGAEMAEAMGEPHRAMKYRTALEKGSLKMDELLWGGEYYIQQIEDVNAYKYQYGKGCLSDQLLGQLLCHVAGLGYILPEAHVKQAVQSIYKYNFRESFKDHHSVQRTYALNDEKGLLLCSWPQGGRPQQPFVYSDEVWPGIEYQVAAHLIYEGFLEEGLTMVKAVRDRHDGYRRNPWNEVECGHHYARSMASWSLLLALTGFQCDMVKKQIHFSPKLRKDDFSTFWSTGSAWGTYTQKKNPNTGKREYAVEVLYGELKDIEVVVDEP